MEGLRSDSTNSSWVLHAKKLGEGHDLEKSPTTQQLSLRISHLEADVASLQQRKGELEKENEALASAAQRPDLQARLEAVLEHNAMLEAECREHSAANAKHAAERIKHSELEQQQAQTARSFAELQGVVRELVGRLTEIDAQREQLSEEKIAAEAAAGALRAEARKFLPRRGGYASQFNVCRRSPTSQYIQGFLDSATLERLSSRGKPRSSSQPHRSKQKQDNLMRKMADRTLELTNGIERELNKSRLLTEGRAYAQPTPKPLQGHHVQQPDPQSFSHPVPPLTSEHFLNIAECLTPEDLNLHSDYELNRRLHELADSVQALNSSSEYGTHELSKDVQALKSSSEHGTHELSKDVQALSSSSEHGTHELSKDVQALNSSSEHGTHELSKDVQALNSSSEYGTHELSKDRAM